MFGEYVEDEITKNLIHITGYPKWVAWAVTFLIAVMPITKAPLNAHPIIVTAESMLGLDQRSIVSIPRELLLAYPCTARHASADYPPVLSRQVMVSVLV